MGYTDKERVDIAKMEYRLCKEGDPVKIDNNGQTIGYVSQVINDKKPANKLTSSPMAIQKLNQVNHIL